MAGQLVRRATAAIVSAALGLALLPALGAPSAGAATRFEAEPNNSLSKANGLALGDVVEATTSGTGFGDADYFFVDVPVAGRLALGFTFPNGLGTGAAYELGLYNADGTQLYEFDVAGGAWDGSWVSRYAIYVPAGRLYVQVYGRESAASWGARYSLSLDVAPGLVETEPNDKTAAADGIPLGQAISGSALGTGWYEDTDYYYVDVAVSGRYALGFTFPNGLGASIAYELEVLNSDGTRLYAFDVNASAYSGIPLGSTALTLPSGRIYVSVSGRSGGISWGYPYTLRVARQLVVTTPPAIVGKGVFGHTLSATPGTWSPAQAQFSYQWLRDGKPIAGATRPSYGIAVTDVGRRLSVRVTAFRNGYLTLSATSEARKVAPAKLTATATPKISGTVKVRKTLTAKPGSWAPKPVAFAYQWYRNGKPIKGAHAVKYKLTKPDKGKKIVVRVTATKPGYAKVVKTSAATKKVK